jgi:hypothetical protein
VADASREYFDQDPKAEEFLKQHLEFLDYTVSQGKSLRSVEMPPSAVANDYYPKKVFTTVYDEKKWVLLIKRVRDEGDEMITEVLKSPIRAF